MKAVYNNFKRFQQTFPKVSRSFSMSPSSKTEEQPVPDLSCLPYFVQGEVVIGFGRGGKQLNCPTANYSENVVDSLPESLTCGVYSGYAAVDDGPVHKAVLSIGWNPFYKNTKKTLETHILQKFDDDFYGSNLKLVIVGFIRLMKDFNSLEELKQAISDDISITQSSLSAEQLAHYRNHSFFKNPSTIC